MVLLTLLVLPAVILLSVHAADAQTEPPVSGDWTVGDVTVIENRTVRLFGDLTITSGGHLTLRNVTLQVFSSSTATRGIRVMDNGTLRVTDLDRRAGTLDDNSVVMRGQPAFGYSFLVETGSLLLMDNGLVSGAGSAGGTGGVIVRTNGSRIKGMTFIEGFRFSLMLDGSRGSTVDHCTFNGSRDGLVLRDCENVSVVNCYIGSNDGTGLRLEDSKGTAVKDCVIEDNDLIGMWVGGGAGNSVDGTHVRDNLRCVVLDSTSGFRMERSQVVGAMYDGLTISPGCVNITIVSSQLWASGRSGLEADGVEDLTLWTSTFEKNEYYGVRLLNGSRRVFFNRSVVRANDYDGVHIERAGDVTFEGGSYANNGYNGIFLIDVDDATLRSARLENNTYNGLDCDSVHGLMMDDLHTRNNGYNGVRLQAGSRGVLVDGCSSIEDTRAGLNIDAANNVTVISFTARQNGGYGVQVEGGAYNVSGRFILSNNTGGALRVQACRDVRLEASDLEQGPAGRYLVYGRAATDIWIFNSTTNGTVHLLSGANVSMVECTFDDVEPDVDVSSWLKFMTLVDVHVLWPNDSPVTGATVNATGVGGQVLARGITDANGLTGELVVLMETHVGDSVASENPITFWASKGAEVARNVTNVLGRSTVTIILKDDEPPVAVAPDVVAELGSRTGLDGAGSWDNGQLVSWVFTFDDGVGTVVLEGRRVNWTFTVLGTFGGQLEVWDSVGLTNTTAFTIRVIDTTPPVAVAGANVTVVQGAIVPVAGNDCTDNDRTLIATGTFLWWVYPETGGSGYRMFNGAVTSIRFPDMGVYRVELNVTDQSGNWDLDRFWVTVLDITPPLVDAGPDLEVGEGEQVVLEPASVTDNDRDFDANLTAWWHVEGPDTDISSDGTVLSFVPPRMGLYTATLHVTDAAGNAAADSRTVTALDRSPPVVALGTDRTVEVHTGTSFDAGAVVDNDPGFPEGASYRWTIEGPLMDEEHRGSSITFTVPWIGEYVITLVVTDAAGNEGSDTVTVTSVDTVLPQFGSFSPGPQDNSDEGDVTVTFVINDEGTGVDAGRVEWRTRPPSGGQWTEWQRVTVTGGVDSVRGTTVLQFPEGSSLFQLRCWDLAGNGPAVSEEHPIRVNSRPRVVLLSPADGADYGPTDEILLDASASSDVDGDNLTFLWRSDVDGVIGAGATARAPPLSPGNHRITVLVSDGLTGHDVLVGATITIRPVPSTVDPDEGIPWWVLAAAVPLFAGFALVVWDHLRRRRTPPPSLEAGEWEETPE